MTIHSVARIVRPDGIRDIAVVGENETIQEWLEAWVTAWYPEGFPEEDAERIMDESWEAVPHRLIPPYEELFEAWFDEMWTGCEDAGELATE